MLDTSFEVDDNRLERERAIHHMVGQAEGLIQDPADPIGLHRVSTR